MRVVAALLVQHNHSVDGEQLIEAIEVRTKDSEESVRLKCVQTILEFAKERPQRVSVLANFGEFVKGGN